MEDLRRIGELVGGNVEHIHALGSLYKQGHWRSVIDFLGQQRLNRPPQIAAIRRILQEYEQCEDEAALRKKYLQLRVQKAAKAKRTLSVEEQMAALGTKREKLVQEIASRSQKIHQMVLQKKAKLKNSLLLSCLADHLAATEEGVAALRERILDRLKKVPLITTTPEPVRSSALEAEIRCVLEGQHDIGSLDQRHAGSVLQEINFQLVDLYAKVAHSVATPCLSPELTQGLADLKNIQSVALELAKLLLLLKSDTCPKQEVLARLDRLRGGVDTQASQTRELGLAELSQLTQDNSKASEETKGHLQRTITLTSELLRADSKLGETLRRAAEIASQSWASEGLAETVGGKAANDGGAGVVSKRHLPDVLIEHCLRATEVPNSKVLVETWQEQSASLQDRLTTTMDKASQRQQCIEARFSKFVNECRSIEELQQGDMKQLMSEINSSG